MTQLFKNHRTIFSIVDEPPSWSEVDDSLESMSDPEDEEEDLPEDKGSSREGADDEDAEVVAVGVHEGEQEEEEDSDGDFFDAGEGAAIDDRVSSRAASKSGQSEGDTEDDPVGPMTPGPTSVPTGNAAKATPPLLRKAHAVSFARTTSGEDGDLDDEEWVDPTPIPATPLDTTPPLFPGGGGAVPSPPMMAKSKSSSSTKSRKRKEARALAAAAAAAATVHVPFPSSNQTSESTDSDHNREREREREHHSRDRSSRREPQMSMARGRDGGRTQSGGVKGVIAPLEPGPEMETELEPGPPGPLPPAEPDDLDADADDFKFL